MSTDNLNSSYSSVADSDEVRRLLGIARPKEDVVAALKDTMKSVPRGSLFDKGGLCDGYVLRPMAEHYFIAQEFSANRNDLRSALTNALAEFNVTPVCADDTIWSGHILCKIGALIQCTPFGVYQLSVSQNRNVYLELGMAVGLDRPFILVKDRAAEVPSLFEGFEYYSLDSYIELRYELGYKIGAYLANIINYTRPELPLTDSAKTVVIAHGELDPVDFCVPIARTIARDGLTPVVLGDSSGKVSQYLEREGIVHRIVGKSGGTKLDETISVIQAARFGVYRIEKDSSADAFLALGMSLGLSRPGFLIHLANHEVPADLRGLSALSFTSYSDLERSFSAIYEQLSTTYS